MIDVMDKHFQEELHLSLSQSAWVQFAHWMGYFLMSLPAGWLATRLGYKGGIIAGLLLVAVGGFWFIPATKIAAFWAFLLGVCVVASGLTFLETVANPYTTVLGPSRYAATRINTAQSCNGVGWIFGPIAGSMFFYGTDAAGRSTGSQTLWIPYAGVAVVVLILAVIFFFAPVPDVKAEDDYHLDDKDNDRGTASAPAIREVNRGLSYALLLGNVAALIGVFIFIFWLTFDVLQLGPRLVGLASAIPHPSSLVVSAQNSVLIVLVAAACLALVAAAIWLIGVTKRLSHHSVWSHEHFSGATLAQFLYVAAQCGIFSFLINYMTSEPPSLPSSWLKESTSKWVEVRTAFAGSDFKDVSALAAKLTAKADPVSAFLAANLSSSTAANPDPLQGRRRQRHRRPRRHDAGPQQPHPQDQHLCAGSVRRRHLAGHDQATARARRPGAQPAPAQPAAARRRLSAGTGLPGRRHRRDQPVRRQAGVGRASSSSCWAGSPARPAAKSSPPTRCSGSTA